MKNLDSRSHRVANLHPILHLTFLAGFCLIHLVFVQYLFSFSQNFKIIFSLGALSTAIFIYACFSLGIHFILHLIWHPIRQIIVLPLFVSLLAIFFFDSILYPRFDSHIIKFIRGYLSNLDRVHELYVYLTTMSNDFSSVLSANLPTLGLVSFSLFLLIKLSRMLPHWDNSLKPRHFFFLAFGSLITLGSIQLYAQYREKWVFFTSSKKLLPIHLSFVKPKEDKQYLLNLGISFRPLMDAQQLKKKADNFSLPTTTKHPPIFLVVIECLRRDAITPETTPELYQFGLNNSQFPTATTASDNTTASFFSIFHGIHSIYMNDYRKKGPTFGSVPVYLLRKMGYKTALFKTVPELGVEKEMYGTESKDFGLDLHYFPTLKDSQAKDNYDQLVSEKVLNYTRASLTDSQPKFITYYISAPHFTYSWPKQFPNLLQPFLSADDVAKIWEGFRPNQGKAIELKNRYLNAVHYADFLFGQFLRDLKNQGIYDESIIVVTGDHGEELLDRGAGFGHGFALNDYDINIALLMKLGNSPHAIRRSISNIDIFPTILDYLGVKGNYAEVFDGISVLKESQLFQSHFAPWSNKVRFQTPELSVTGVIDFQSAETSKNVSVFEVLHEGLMLDNANPTEIGKYISDLLIPNSPDYVRLFPLDPNGPLKMSKNPTEMMESNPEKSNRTAAGGT